MKKKLFLFKAASFLLAFAPLAAIGGRSILAFAGEPELPAKLTNKKDANI